MKGFFIKKAFFDGWDNLIGMVIMNLGYILLFLAALSSLTLIGNMDALAYVLLLLIIFVGSIAMGGVASATYGWSNYQSGTFAAFKEGLTRNIRHRLLYVGLQLFQCVFISIVFPFYFGNSGPVFLIISVVLFWFEIVLLLALPYYFPLMSRLPGDRPLKTLKKCFIVFIDNFGFSIFFGIYNLICTLLTIFTFGLIPGVAGMQLAKQDAMKLLMFKYDYLEENENADRRHIPWEDLIYDEREKLGPRSFKNMIFPWK